MDWTDRPTLLIFTLGPGRERARRRWLPSESSSLERRLHEQCLEAVLDAGREAGCRLRICSPGARPLSADAQVDRQPEHGFGRRLIGAIDRAMVQATGPLLVVGTDTPGLTSKHLLSARRALARDPEEVVVGPAADGGIYLLATARPLADVLARVRWQRTSTLDSLVLALEAAGRPVRMLPVLTDLDSRQDLERWLAASDLAEGVWRALVGALRLAVRRLGPSPIGVCPQPWWRTVPIGRGPPR